MITKADFLGLIVNDVEKAKQFYQDKLKMKVNPNLDMPGEFVAFQLDGGAMFALQKEILSSKGPVQQSFMMGLVVTDADATYKEYQESGVDVLEEPQDQPYGRTFLFRTPDGHVLRAYQPPNT